jgi:superfamily II DNA/RNA helicase
MPDWRGVSWVRRKVLFTAHLRSEDGGRKGPQSATARHNPKLGTNLASAVFRMLRPACAGQAVLLRRHGRDSACVTADTREATRRHLVDAFRRRNVQILCNYGVLTTGFDAPQVRAVVIGRPTASRVLYDQMIGRGMRGPAFGGTEECLVIDVDDNLVHLKGNRLTTAAHEYVGYWTR